MLAPIPVHEVMVEDIVTVGPGETVSTAAVRLDERGVGSLVVKNGGPVGIVTEADVVSVFANGHDPSTVTISDFDDLGKGMYRLSTRVFDDGELVIDGLATVMADDHP